MAKRSGFQFHKPRSKMPKLDSQYMASQMMSSQRAPAPSFRMPPLRQPDPARVPESEDMWGDDDDDSFIMLASQAADRAEARPNAGASQAVNMSVAGDLSYGVFQRNVQASTQKVLPTKNTDVIELLSPDDEDLMNIPMPAGDKTLRPGPSKNNASRADGAVKTDHMETQNQYLQGKNREQRKEIEMLKHSMQEMNEKCQQKDGEAASLRYELNTKQLMIDRLRKEKLAETGAQESKYVEKINELEKAMESMRNENAFKDLDTSIHHQRRPSKTLLVPESPIVRQQEAVLSEAALATLFQLHLPPIESTHGTLSAAKKVNMAQLFSVITSNSQATIQEMSGVNPELIAHFQSLQTSLHIASFDSSEAAAAKVLAAAQFLITELARTLNGSIDRIKSKDYKLTMPVGRDAWTQRARNNTTLNKRLCYESRVLTAVAAICGQQAGIAVKILNQEKDDEHLIDALVAALNEVAIAEQSEVYKDLLGASILFLKVLNEQITPSKKRNEILFNVFRSIVSCQPDISQFEPLSHYVATIAKQSTMNIRLCVAAGCERLFEYPSSGSFNSSIKACPLQVYAIILDMGVRGIETLPLGRPDAHLTAIAHIAINSMTFLRDCIERSRCWFNVPGADGTPSDQNCHCYAFMVVSTISQLYALITCWVKENDCLDGHLVQTIFKMAAVFLYDNLSLNFRRRYVQVAGLPIKNRLQVVYNFLLAFVNVLKFEEGYDQAIKMVNLRKIPEMNEPQNLKHHKPIERSQSAGLDVLNNTFDQFFNITDPI